MLNADSTKNLYYTEILPELIDKLLKRLPNI